MDLIRIILLSIFLLCLIYISFRIFVSQYEFFKIIYSFVLVLCLCYVWEINFSPKDKNLLTKLVGFDIRIPIINFILLAPVIIKAPYLRYYLHKCTKFWHKNKKFAMVSHNTQKQILEAVLEISEKKIGALITIEKHNSLEQFAQKSILIDGKISKELLINIFIPNTPLHDGAVIIRGDRILSAGAYFMLSEKQYFKKTTGSRHRAALGISENTDSMTIIVSEETGNISIALEGIMLKMKDANQIQEYLVTFMI